MFFANRVRQQRKIRFIPNNPLASKPPPTPPLRQAQYMLVRGGARSAPLFLRHRILPLYICSGSSGLGKPQRSLAFAGAVSVAIDRAEDGLAEPGPTVLI